jgi:hypothetical protein
VAGIWAGGVPPEDMDVSSTLLTRRPSATKVGI